MFYFDYGCVAFWGLTQKQEQDILRNIVVPCEENPLPPSDVEIDEFQVCIAVETPVCCTSWDASHHFDWGVFIENPCCRGPKQAMVTVQMF